MLAGKGRGVGQAGVGIWGVRVVVAVIGIREGLVFGGGLYGDVEIFVCRLARRVLEKCS